MIRWRRDRQQQSGGHLSFRLSIGTIGLSLAFVILSFPCSHETPTLMFSRKKMDKRDIPYPTQTDVSSAFTVYSPNDGVKPGASQQLHMQHCYAEQQLLFKNKFRFPIYFFPFYIFEICLDSQYILLNMACHQFNL